MKKRYKVIVAILTVCTCLMSACGKNNANTKVVLTTGFDRDEVFRIDSVSCSKSEVMVYLTISQYQDENIFGAQIGEQDFVGVTLE